ncbi:hypothetical protein BpHYR1_028462 [Brachionus plicatilis]|uniref:Uncharacterized protein n=1 Tax=Brachionus plicatilis TaxID=10195 RepID=A0A3M7STF0_BRAPC|nr:hypothetical protein BpHYR1_028462 [Brachionus plicatilis]
MLENKNKLFIVPKCIKTPWNFDAIIGQIQDFNNFFSFQLKLNDWCRRNSAKYAVTTDGLSMGQYVLIKGAKETVQDDHLFWKRSKIISMNNESQNIMVFLVDESSTVEIQSTDLRIDLPEFYSEFEPQIKKCCLRNVEPQDDTGRWSSESIEYFKKLMSQTGLNALILSENKTNCLKHTEIERKCFDKELVIEVINDNMSLRNQLISNGYAKMSSPAYINVEQKESDLSNEEIVEVENKNEKIQVFNQRIDSNSSIDSESDDFVFLYSSVNGEIVKDKNLQSTVPSKRALPSEANFEAEISDESSSSSLNKKFKISDNLNHLNLNSDKEKSELNTSFDAELKDNDELYICHKNTDPNRKIITPQSIIYSDETIATGYKPNVDFDPEELTQAIKFVNLQRLHSLRGISFPNNLPKPKILTKTKDRLAEIKETESRVFNILGDETINLEFKVKKLVKIYSENTSINSILIIKSVLNEIAQSNFTCENGISILKEFGFCADDLFIRALNEYVENVESVYSNSLYYNLTNVNVKSMSDLLSKLYKYYLKNTDVFCLQRVREFCQNRLKKWFNYSSIKNVPISVYKQNFKNIRDFLEGCLSDFKQFDFDTCQYIYNRAKAFFLDNSFRNDLKSEVFLIVDIFAQDFFSNSNSMTNTPDTSVREFRSFANFRRNLENQVKTTDQLKNSPGHVFRFAKYRQN